MSRDYISYDCGDYWGAAWFIRKCPICGRFVKADKELEFSYNMLDNYKFGLNATCSKHGRVKMPFEGWFS